MTIKGWKHREDIGYAGRSNKGERVGGFAHGVRKNTQGWGENNSRDYWKGAVFTAFVDNLSSTITKWDLYKEFGKDGFVKDIFISRMNRRYKEGNFAFVRYGQYNSVMRAIDRLNGVLWKGQTLLVSRSKFGRDGDAAEGKYVQSMNRVAKKGCSLKWVPVKRPAIHDERGTEGKQNSITKDRKKIQGVWAEDQKERLQRSLLGVCVEPIDFRRAVMGVYVELVKTDMGGDNRIADQLVVQREHL
ncbi:hypothetical protein PIB30_053662 [Stylosanthes scabra]|uniref:RRM domain-containing protein n=1 Tax=Stylosanthes scabra TaxID=79078 RepID=A0ABU6QJ97_9FABA|nr:hypothetical protein [Stylosanthes scabra]